MLELEVLIWELLAVDRLAASAITVCEVAYKEVSTLSHVEGSWISTI